MSKKLAKPKKANPKSLYEGVVKDNYAKGFSNAKPHYYGEADGVHVMHATHPDHANLIGAHHQVGSEHEFHRALEDASSKGFRTLILHGEKPAFLGPGNKLLSKSLVPGQSYNDLKKSEVPRGFISPKGKYHELPEGDMHHDWIHRHTKENEPKLHAKSPDHEPYKYADQSYQKALKAGWMSVGIGRDEGAEAHNVQADKSILNDKLHPATVKVRDIAKKHWGEKFEHMDKGSHTNFDTKHFVKHGVLKEYK